MLGPTIKKKENQYLKKHKHVLTRSKNQAQFRMETKFIVAKGIYCRLHTTNRNCTMQAKTEF
jgi:hypothetical protein